MARRVNTKFVIILGSVLLLGALGALGMVATNWFNGRDPKWLIAKAKEAEKAGNIPSAMSFYARAGLASARTHEPNTADLYFQAAEYAKQLSAQETDPTKADNYYQQAMNYWTNALNVNVHYLPAQTEILNEVHKQADFVHNIPAWSGLRDVATRVIEIDPKNGDAYMYHAQANFQLLQNISGTGSVTDSLKGIDADLQKALTLSPDAPMPVVLKSVVLEFEAHDLDSRNLVPDAAKFRAAASALLNNYLAKHPNNPETSLQLARIAGTNGHIDDMLKILAESYKANPGNELVGDALASVQRYTDRAAAEKVLKELIAAKPEATENYRQLAAFYYEMQKYDDALQMNKEVLDHLEPGGGVAKSKRAINQTEALYNLCWISLDKAEHEHDGVTSPAGKADLAAAGDYTDKFRAIAPPRALLSLIDGRMHFLRNEIPEAVTDLRSADATFSVGDSRAPQWAQTKILLGKCFERPGGWGTAIGYYDDILKAEPQNVPIMIRRAYVYNQVGRYQEAHDAIGKLIIEKLPEGLRNLAMTIDATALDKLGRSGEAKTLFTGLHTPIARLNEARSKAMGGDLEGALVEINDLIAEDPKNEMAYSMAVMINVQLHHKEKAQELLNDALEKFPKNTQFQVMQASLKTSAGDSNETQIAVLKTIPDDYARFMSLAQFYRHVSGHEKDAAAMRQDHQEELSSLEQAFATLDNTPAHHDNYAQVVDLIFNVAVSMGETAATPDEKNKYFDIAQKYVAVAERDNLDGSNGKLYQGRLQFIREDHQKGLRSIEQAVAQYPDFSFGHTMLGRAYLESANDPVGDGTDSVANDKARTSMVDKSLSELRVAISQDPSNLPAIKLAISVLTARSADPAAMAEANSLLTSANRIAPHDPDVMIFNDQIGDAAAAIQARVNILHDTPPDQMYNFDSIENIKRLAMLYVRVNDDIVKKADDPGLSDADHQRAIEVGKQDLRAAIALLRPLFDRDPTNLETADILARLYKQTDQTNDALTMYERFMASPDKNVRFDTMLLHGDMEHSMGNDPAAIENYLEARGLESPSFWWAWLKGNDQAERRLADLYFEIDSPQRPTMHDAEVNYQAIYNNEKVHDDRVVRRLAEAMIRQATSEHPEKFATADGLLDMLFKSDPDDPEGRVLQGFSYFKQGKFDQATADFNKILNDPKTSAESHYRYDALYYRAFAQYERLKDLDQAIKDLNIVITGSSDTTNARLLLARIYRASQHYAEAVSEYSTLVIRNPDLWQGRVEFAEFLFTLAQLQKKLPPESQEDIAYVIRTVRPADMLMALLDDTEKKFPDPFFWKVPLLIIRGDLLALYNRPDMALQAYALAYQGAITNQELVPNLKPRAASAYLNSLVLNKKYDDAIAVANEVITADPKAPDAYLKRAAAYAGKGHTAEATADITQAIALSAPDPALAITNARQASVVLPPATVISLLQQRLDANHGEVGTRMALADIQIQANQPADAVKTIASLRDDASLPPLAQQTVLRTLALGEYEAKSYPAAQADYNTLLKQNPDDVESLNNLAFMLADDLKRPKDGLPYAERAVKAMNSSGSALNLTSNGNVLDTHGWVLYLSGDATGGMADLQRAVSLNPTPISYLHLALAEQKSGRSADASNAVTAGLKLSSDKNDPSVAGLQALQKTLNPQ